MNNKFINIKEKIMKKVLVGIIAVVAAVNVFFNLYNRNEIIGLSSLKIEALAFDESHGSNLGSSLSIWMYNNRKNDNGI